MGKYILNLSNKAVKDLKYIYKSGDKSNLIRIEKIFEELQNTPFKGIGKPELLKYKFSGYWSRRINQKDRIIYKVEEEAVTVFVVSAKGHYDDE
jgi:toxin YoeB